MASLNIGDFVWAKMKGFPAWPGRIVEPNDSLKKIPRTEQSKCVYFFGSHNHAWIESKDVNPYNENKEQMLKLGKSKASFGKAIKEIEKFMAGESEIVTTPARQAATPKIRKPNVNALDESIDASTDNSINENVDDQSSAKAVTPVTPIKVPIKRSTQKKSKPTVTPKQSDEDEIPAKRARSTPKSPVVVAAAAVAVANSSNHHNNINNNNHEAVAEIVPKAEFVPRVRAARAIIDRPHIFLNPEAQELDVSTITETLKSKNIKASKKKFGFIGLGIMGSGIVKNLINSGHDVSVYNRAQDKTKKFEDAGAKVMMTPSDVIENADITFSCVADPDALKNTVFGPYGVSSLDASVARGKSYVEMTTIDTVTSKDVESALHNIGMTYLEAQIQGTKSQAEEGKLILLAAGDKSLFDACQTCFEAMGKNSFFVGETGNATKMNLVLQTIAGVQIAGLADSIALAERAGLNTESFMEILSETNMCSDLIMEKGLAMIDHRFTNVNLPLQHMQKDLRLAINMADSLNQPMPLTAIANEGYKHARRMGAAESDASAIVYRR